MIIRNSIFNQFVFWILMIGVHFVFISQLVSFPSSMYFVVNTMIFTGLSMFGNIYFIYPKLYNSEHNNQFNVVSVLMITLLAIAFGYIDWFLYTKYTISPIESNNYSMLASIIKSVFWLTLVHLTSTIYMLQEGLKKKNKETRLINEEKLNTELKYLKAQINPHFLFNALNNIYSLSYMKSDKGPDAILKLSGMLRYVLEDCQNDKVSLHSEVDYIKNFIDFQQMKSPVDQNIEFNHGLVDQSVKVAPMLFISFLENSFKYSKVENTKDAFVNISMQTKEKELFFEIRNSIPAKGKAASGSGKGI